MSSRFRARRRTRADNIPRLEDRTTILPTNKLVPLLPSELIFTIDPTWLAKAGTVALGVASPRSAGGKGRIASRADGREAGWRPGSIFGGLWATPEPLVEDKEGEEEELEEGERTLKGDRASLESAESGGDFQRPPKSLAHHPASTKARLSSLFTDWIAPEASTSRIIPSAPITVASSADSTSLSARGNRFSMIDLSTSGEADSDDPEPDLDSALEALMVSVLDRLAVESCSQSLIVSGGTWHEAGCT